MSTRTHFEKAAKGNSDKGEANDEGLTRETSALKLFMVANLHYQLSWWNQIILLYSPANAAPQFL